MEAGNYGIISLVPPLVMLIFALKTRKSFESLILGTITAYVILYGFRFIGPWCEMLLDEISNPDNQYILLLCGLFGGFIFLLKEAKGTIGFSNALSRFCKSERSVLLTSVVMGIAIFVDDYLNIMTIGTCMNDLCDKRKVPRQALAYVIDSTGAPVCALLPFSTWVVFYAGIFFQEPAVVALGYGNGMNTYLHAIPYMFYPIAALLIVILFAAGIMPKFGPMKTYYANVRSAPKKVEYAQHNAPSVDIAMAGMAADYPPPTGNQGSLFDFLIPIAFLIGVTLMTGDMLTAIVVALAVCMILYIPRKKMSFTRYVELFFAGFADILPVLGILLASFMIRDSCGRLGLSEYVISLAEPIMSGWALPAIVFVLIAGMTFVTASFWGIEAIAIPIVVPLCGVLGGNVLLTLAAVVSGGVFGSHACFYSDATVLSSATCEIDNLSHAASQVPYALLGAVLSTAAYLLCGWLL